MSGDGEKKLPIDTDKAKERLHDAFLITGLKERVQAELRKKLVEGGTTWDMRDGMVGYIKKKGPQNVNAANLIKETAPAGQDLVPSDIKKELVERMYEVAKEFFTLDDTLEPPVGASRPHTGLKVERFRGYSSLYVLAMVSRCMSIQGEGKEVPKNLAEIEEIIRRNNEEQSGDTDEEKVEDDAMDTVIDKVHQLGRPKEN